MAVARAESAGWNVTSASAPNANPPKNCHRKPDLRTLRITMTFRVGTMPIAASQQIGVMRSFRKRYSGNNPLPKLHRSIF
ncbi:hypothetical protein AB5I39_09005 [Sphingomonas sp. MMS24-J45]|uniref:hypothetical protein n=1 Tax=Sphingomonas sp. MMS24-J45 TaxID=3238806 RepID=UPI00384C4DAF